MDLLTKNAELISNLNWIIMGSFVSALFFLIGKSFETKKYLKSSLFVISMLFLWVLVSGYLINQKAKKQTKIKESDTQIKTKYIVKEKIIYKEKTSVNNNTIKKEQKTESKNTVTNNFKEDNKKEIIDNSKENKTSKIKESKIEEKNVSNVNKTNKSSIFDFYDGSKNIVEN